MRRVAHTSLPPKNRHLILNTRIGPLTQSQKAIQTRTKSMTKAVVGTAPLAMPGIRPKCSSSQMATPSLIIVMKPKNVGQSFSQRHCMIKWYRHSQTIPITATAARMMNVSRYAFDNVVPAGSGSTGVMIRVTSPPITASSAIRVWIRPPSVGSTFVPPVKSSETGGAGRGCSCRGEACARAHRQAPGPLVRLRLLVTCPLHPLRDRPEGADLLAEPAPGQVVGDLLRGDLQPEERVNPWEVTAKRCRSRCVNYS